jgi:hypothetical protein
MIRIAITEAAYEAIAAAHPFDSVGHESKQIETGEVLIWLRLAKMMRRVPAHGGAGARSFVSP